jgi:hypothetical protein
MTGSAWTRRAQRLRPWRTGRRTCPLRRFRPLASPRLCSAGRLARRRGWLPSSCAGRAGCSGDTWRSLKNPNGAPRLVLSAVNAGLSGHPRVHRDGRLQRAGHVALARYGSSFHNCETARCPPRLTRVPASAGLSRSCVAGLVKITNSQIANTHPVYGLPTGATFAVW